MYSVNSFSGHKPDGIELPRILRNSESWNKVGKIYGLELKPGTRLTSPLREGAGNPNSFVLNEDGTWHDFGESDPDRNHGDAVKFVIMKEGCSFIEAVQKISSAIGLKVDTKEFQAQYEIDKERGYVVAFNGVLAEFANKKLDPAKRQYLKGRGFSNEFIDAKKIGYLTFEDTEELAAFCMDRGVMSAPYVVSQLSDRILIPYWDTTGTKVQYYIGRTTEGGVEPKYMKPSRKGREQMIPNPIFGLESLVNVHKTKRLILSEGVFDALTLIQAGEASLASCGGQFSKQHIGELLALVKSIRKEIPTLEMIIWFDYDPESQTGQKSTTELADILLRNGIFPKIVRLDGKNRKIDVNSLMCDESAGALSIALEAAVPYLKEQIDEINGQENGLAKIDLLRVLARKLSSAGLDPIKMEHVLEDVSLKDKYKRDIIRESALSPQDIAVKLAKKKKYLHRNGKWYERDGNRFVLIDDDAMTAQVRNEAEDLVHISKVTKRNVEEILTCLSGRVKIPGNVSACSFDIDSDGRISVSPIGDPCLAFPNAVVLLDASGPKRIGGGDIFTTLSFPYEYNDGAECPEWTKCIGVYLPDPEIRNIIQELAGFLLYPDHVEVQAFGVFIGDGSNGKGTVVRGLQEMMGTQLCASFMLGSFQNAHAPSGLVGKRLIAIPELDKHESTSVALIKSWTGGDPVHMNPKHKSPFTYLPEGKMLVTTNVRPYLPDPSNGIFRRLIPVEFRYRIEAPNGTIERKLKAEVAGILNWSIEGYYRLKTKGGWNESNLPKPVLELREEICMEGDPFRRWIKDRLEQVPNSKLYCKPAYIDYLNWTQENKLKFPMNKITFGQRLKTFMNREPLHGEGRHYIGWKVKSGPV